MGSRRLDGGTATRARRIGKQMEPRGERGSTVPSNGSCHFVRRSFPMDWNKSAVVHAIESYLIWKRPNRSCPSSSDAAGEIAWRYHTLHSQVCISKSAYDDTPFQISNGIIFRFACSTASLSHTQVSLIKSNTLSQIEKLFHFKMFRFLSVRFAMKLMVRFKASKRPWHSVAQPMALPST